MARHRHQPFFAYYPMALTHGPFNTTPRSDDWATADRLKDDPNYFKDMVAYLDRLGLADNTIVLFYADNGTPPEITSPMGLRTIPGGKRLTSEASMRVRPLARWPGHNPAGRLCDDLIDPTDFLPTLMETTGTFCFPGLPLDGRSFFPQIQVEKGRPAKNDSPKTPSSPTSTRTRAAKLTPNPPASLGTTAGNSTSTADSTTGKPTPPKPPPSKTPPPARNYNMCSTPWPASSPPSQPIRTRRQTRLLQATGGRRFPAVPPGLLSLPVAVAQHRLRKQVARVAPEQTVPPQHTVPPQ
ncbi:MAG: sulfatase-like hydrolase/transferase [Acidobacteriota bacterium]